MTKYPGLWVPVEAEIDLIVGTKEYADEARRLAARIDCYYWRHCGVRDMVLHRQALIASWIRRLTKKEATDAGNDGQNTAGD